MVQEAVATGDPEILQMVLERRDIQRYTSRMAGIPELLQKLKDAPDFYVEMKWEFTSWGNYIKHIKRCSNQIKYLQSHLYQECALVILIKCINRDQMSE